MKKYNNSSATHREPQLLGDIFYDMLHSDSPFACGLHQHIGDVYPNTEPGVDLKFITHSPCRLDIGQSKHGRIMRDDTYHYVFVETSPQTITKNIQPRSIHIYRGKYVNLLTTPAGLNKVTINRATFSSKRELRLFLQRASEEMTQLAEELAWTTDEREKAL